MRRTKDANAGLSAIEILIIIVCICFLALMVLPALRHREYSRRHGSCKSNLKQLGTAMNIYLTKFGGDAHFAEPAAAFRGDEFVGILFWKGIVGEPMLFVCPATSDTGPRDAFGNPVPMPIIWNEAGSLTDEQCSYAGRCKGVTGKYAHRNTPGPFSESIMGSASAMACDKAGNHSDGVNVVYFDSHVTFIPCDAIDYVGRNTSGLAVELGELRHMDSGEE